MEEVPLAAQHIERFLPFIGQEALHADLELSEALRRRFEGRVIWNVSSTARGGGVAEMVRALLPYARGAGVDFRWLVLDGSPEFFQITKRLHHAIHGSKGDGSPLGEEQRRIYEEVLAREFESMRPHLGTRDLALLHDPQTAGLIPWLEKHGIRTIWRCHIGSDEPSDESNLAWGFLERYLSQVRATVFTRYGYIPACCDSGRATIIHPSIDPFAPKNQDLDGPTVRAILRRAGIVDGSQVEGTPVFHRDDGSPARVELPAAIRRLGPAPTLDTPLVVQVSRWDPLKDPVGVMRGFARTIEIEGANGAHLVLAGPDTSAVADDPEGEMVYQETVAAWAKMPDDVRRRIHLASLPMEDPEENAAIVNALQRHASVIVQKSLAEGFGLTVTEAMAKGRPILASAVGGIQEQIVDGVHGRLLQDPRDPDEFARVLSEMLSDREAAEAMGRRAKERAMAHFFGPRSLRQYAALLVRVDEM